MKAKAPAFQFYASDFLSDINVTTMTMSQRGVYITLMAHEWLEGKLPSDVSTLKRLCGNPEDWNNDWHKVSTCFVEKDGYIYNPRLEQERGKMNAYRERMSQAGKKGAEKRWKDSPAIAKPSNKKIEGEVERESKKEIKKEFEEEFWQKYPRKQGKVKAMESYIKIRKTFCQENIIMGLDMYIKYWTKTGKEIEYIPMASTWLNQERFIDVSIGESGNSVVTPTKPTSYEYKCDACEKEITVSEKLKSVNSICACGEGVLMSIKMFDYEQAIKNKNQEKISTPDTPAANPPRGISTVGATMDKLRELDEKTAGHEDDEKTKFEREFSNLVKLKTTK